MDKENILRIHPYILVKIECQNLQGLNLMLHVQIVDHRLLFRKIQRVAIIVTVNQ